MPARTTSRGVGLLADVGHSRPVRDFSSGDELIPSTTQTGVMFTCNRPDSIVL